MLFEIFSISLNKIDCFVYWVIDSSMDNLTDNCFLGYSLQLFSRSYGPSAYPYKGEWISRVITMTNDWLCVSLNLSVPAAFQVSVDLLTNTTTKTIYTADNVVGETVATEMLTAFEVQADAIQTQLVVYVSKGTIIRNVDIQNEHCRSTGELLRPSFLWMFALYRRCRIGPLFRSNIVRVVSPEI